jgi:hypothetical protein
MRMAAFYWIPRQVGFDRFVGPYQSLFAGQAWAWVTDETQATCDAINNYVDPQGNLGASAGVTGYSPWYLPDGSPTAGWTFPDKVLIHRVVLFLVTTAGSPYGGEFQVYYDQGGKAFNSSIPKGQEGHHLGVSDNKTSNFTPVIDLMHVAHYGGTQVYTWDQPTPVLFDRTAGDRLIVFTDPTVNCIMNISIQFEQAP